jgi:hypothetical protein
MPFSCIIRLHNSLQTREEIAKLCLTVLPYPPYSLNLDPSDFYLFGPLKNAIHKRKFWKERVNKGEKMWLQETPQDFNQQGLKAHFQVLESH